MAGGLAPGPNDDGDPGDGEGADPGREAGVDGWIRSSPGCTVVGRPCSARRYPSPISELTVVLERSGALSLPVQLADGIRSQVASRALAPGDALPSTRLLASRLS
jgi:hypothetical protein